MVRIKHRYLLVNILYPELEDSPSKPKVPDVIVFNQPTTESLREGQLRKAIESEIFKLFGEYGAGATNSNLQIKYWSPATSTFILRVSRDHYRIVWAALSFIKSVPVRGGRNCVFRVVRVSGTIRKVEQEAIRRAREMILRAQREGSQRGDAMLESIFEKAGEKDNNGTKDILMVDGSDEDEEDSED